MTIICMSIWTIDIIYAPKYFPVCHNVWWCFNLWKTSMSRFLYELDINFLDPVSYHYNPQPVSLETSFTFPPGWRDSPARQRFQLLLGFLCWDELASWNLRIGDWLFHISSLICLKTSFSRPNLCDYAKFVIEGITIHYTKQTNLWVF